MSGSPVLFVLGPSAILALGLVLAALVRRRRPEAACAVLRAALSGSLALPLLFALVAVLHLRTVPVPQPGFLGRWAAWEPAADVSVESSVDFDGGRIALPQLDAAPVAAETPRPVSRILSASPVEVAVWVWVLGAAFFLFRLALAHGRAVLWRAAALPASEELVRRVGLLAARLGIDPVEVRITERLSVPALVGLRRPAMLVPASGPEPEDAVLLHELAHAARRDVAWLLCARLAAAVRFFDPLAWLAARLQEERAEEACDDRAVAASAANGAGAYARQLVDLAEREAWGREIALAAPSVVAFRSAVGRRVARLVEGAPGLRLGLGAALGIGTTAAACVLFLGFARPAEAKEKGLPTAPALSSYPPAPVGVGLPIRKIDIVFADCLPEAPEAARKMVKSWIEPRFAPGEAFTPELVRLTVKKLYATDQMVNVRITGDEVDGQENVTLMVQLYPPLRSASFAGEAPPEAQALLDDVRSRFGQSYGERAAYLDARRIEAALRASGHPDARVTSAFAIAGPDRDRGEVVFTLNQEEKK